MLKRLLILPVALLSLTSCGTVYRMIDLMNESSESIEANTCAIQHSTQTIRQNARSIQASTETMKANLHHLEAATK